MKALVTGGTGFVGLHLTAKLEALGWTVDVCDRRGGFDVCDVSWKYGGRVDAVFHLAAVSRVQPSFNRVDETLRTNVDGTRAVLDFCVERKSALVFVSSSAVLQNTSANPYSLSKYIGEQLCAYYREFKGLRVDIVQPFNVFGPGQAESGEDACLVGLFHGAAKAGRPLVVSGDGEQRRDFVHVDDVVSAIVAAAGSAGRGGVYQVGSGVSRSINEIAAAFQTAFGGLSVERTPLPPGEIRNAAMSSTAAWSLGWRPTVDVIEYIRELGTRHRGGLVW